MALLGILFFAPAATALAHNGTGGAASDYRIEIVFVTAAVLLAATYLLTRRREVEEVEVALAA